LCFERNFLEFRFDLWGGRRVFSLFSYPPLNEVDEEYFIRHFFAALEANVEEKLWEGWVAEKEGKSSK
jgi:hypothetical protein